jgi:hypothetical protein
MPARLIRETMNTKTLSIALLTVTAVFFTSQSVKADTLNLGNCGNITTSGAACPNVDSGKTQLAYSDGVISLTASAFLKGSTNTPTNLYVKQGGTNETGLGTTVDVDHEINPGDFIDLNLSSLFAKGVTSGTLTLESLQTGEGFKVCQGSVVGSLGSNCVTGGAGTGTTTLHLTWTNTTDIIGVTAFNADGLHPQANVLIDGITATVPTPEPATITLLVFGIAGLACRRRRLSKKQ